MSEKSLLQFLPFASAVESGFWNKLTELKLDAYKLDDSRKPLKGFYMNSDLENLPCRHTIDYETFQENRKPPPLCYLSHGGLYNKNTIEEFKTCDKKSILQHEADLVWKAIMSGDAITHPDLLVRFSLLSFADLKKYFFHYWFAFPSFVHTIPISFKAESKFKQHVSEGNFMNALQKAVHVYQKQHKSLPGFFLITSTNVRESDKFEVNAKIHKLTDFDTVFASGTKITFGVCDPSTMPEYPGWPLRNYLTLIAYHWAKQLQENIDVICFRDRCKAGKRDITHSLLFSIHLASISECPINVTGWEKNKKNKFTSRYVNLADSMDPIKLAESAVNLNLKLMKWRLMPSLDLEKFSKCKCLLLGAGTLGCNVARSLLGWGVTNITFVDNGTVSFSNPVRQTLFEFSDCSATGGRMKAVAAAERLTKIYPGINSKGIVMSIPMPGHPIHSSDELVSKVKADVEILEDLIESHDVIYLLMDTRESRWLPTLISAAKGKLVINAALGFDSYLVMRHGVNSDSQQHTQSASSSTVGDEQESKLGCYFCNDVIGPGNSMKDRTLDQQCTVSRPGVSMIASAQAVELMAGILQHPHGVHAFPNTSTDSSDYEGSCLGPVPHQIRGFLSHNHVFYPVTKGFKQCTGCSDVVVNEYKEKGFKFLLEVFNLRQNYLEDLTGLTVLHESMSSIDCSVLEFSDAESI